MLALLVDWGVLCLPALPGVLWVLASEAKKSLFIPLCLDVVLHVWQVAIWDKREGMKPLILHVRHPCEQNKGCEAKASKRFPEERSLKQSCKCSVKVLGATRTTLIYLPACGNQNVGRWSCSRLNLIRPRRAAAVRLSPGRVGVCCDRTSAAVTKSLQGHRKQDQPPVAAAIRSAYKPRSYTGQPTASQMSDPSIAISQLGNSSQ